MEKKYEVTSVDAYPTSDGFRLDWTAKNMGFGILLFKRNKDGSHSLDTEMMSKEFCMAVLQKLLDNAYKD